ncbi:transglutaminaseTgpA domain-containing protein [Halorussus gelatinilyticus]|uniref:TransglutaminaseTgpA domain-containing protein n=1 Tax=Halorussus gelatinilyticus TaxID=2937524 RepID=A0A8U0IHH4_9EURY|nr:transglutaminase domain-containing protein [Halorussus gelatinilyticus]UPV99711.1 transglutaminaseTgpA domain-containing protein [Halorussus gelatinilyticus]
MSDEPAPLLPDDEQSRDRLRAALVACCVLAVVLAGTLVPAISGAGLGSTPLGSAVPQPGVNPYGASQGSGGAGSGGGLGALNPGERTGVGGSLAAENRSSAFRSQNAETHFRVRSSVPSYWRTGAYDTYTGSGWKQSGERRRYDGPIRGGGIRGREVRYRVTLERSATALPSVWRANAIRTQSDASDVYVTDARAFETGSPVSPGTTYTGVSHLPARDPTVLRAAGRNYPSEVERRYTDLPADTDRRIGEFTDDLTAGSTSAYEEARRIESWLEANKNYSLNVSQPAGEDVASQFVFDMERGYCEYFATAMTVMLRSQDIPARYVVGYSTGQSVGENTYEVRGMNAHAWVEVYFPEVGWVRFDPTPGRERIESEQQALANQTSADPSDYSPTETGSPGERFSANRSNATGGGNSTATTGAPGTRPGESGTATPSGETPATASTPTDGTTDGERPSSTTVGGETTRNDRTTTETTRTDTTASRYAVRLNRTPVPGATVEVTVTDDGDPAIGVPVAFNGKQVGRTDTEGTVTARVPYAENLRITVGKRAEVEQARLSGPPAWASDAVLSLADPPRSLTDPPTRSSSSPPGAVAIAADNESNGTEYALATNASLAVSGDVATGNEVVVTATVEGVPVRNADVRLGGETVGTTDRNGRLRVELPESPGNVTLAVSRGSVSGERTLTLPRLELAADPQFPLALPGSQLEVSATYGGEPLTNATVTVAGTRKSTGIDGTATAALPFQRRAEIAVTAEGQTRRTTVSGLLVNLGLSLGGVALVLGGLAFAASRRGVTPRTLLDWLVRAVRAIPALAVAALFGAADRLAWAVETVGDALRELAAGRTTVSELLARLRAWLGERTRTVSLGPVRSLGGGPSPDVSGPEDDAEADSYRTLREAWATFLREVSVRRPAASTPGELADHAVREDDLPPAAVVTLRDAFRDVEYGARSPTDRLARVEEAVETIERAAREERERDSPDAPDARPGGDD